MTPERCKQIRKALGLSQKGLGRLIGMKGKSPERNIYDWENKPGANIPGPSANLLEYIAQGLPMTVQALDLPRHALTGQNEDRPLLIRLWRPRMIMDATTGEIIQWIDQPDDEEDEARILKEARAYLKAQD